jgi:isoquinoline 1-oxidoreductase alpha subunit
MTTFTLNGTVVNLDLNPEMPLLWVLRDELGLTGTKFGCGGGFCGACTIHIEGQATRACQIPLRAAEGLNVRTIEAFGDDASHPVQVAWAKINVSQCGYCQPGQIMSAIALLEQNPSPGDADIDRAMNGNLCRCGTYPRVKAAIKLAAD